MTIHYSICHNDDDPSDPSHRRVLITFDGRNVLADGEPVEMAPDCATEEAARSVIEMLWGVPYWDLREEDGGCSAEAFAALIA